MNKGDSNKNNTEIELWSEQSGEITEDLERWIHRDN